MSASTAGVRPVVITARVRMTIAAATTAIAGNPSGHAPVHRYYWLASCSSGYLYRGKAQRTDRTRDYRLGT